MKRRDFFKGLSLLSGGAFIPAGNMFAEEREASAVAGVRGKVRGGSKGLAGVAISDGFSIVQTAKDGSYHIQPDSKAAFIFVILPAGYEIPHVNHIAAFYQPISANRTNIDFQLHPLQQDDARHAFIVWGDTQILDDRDAQLLITTAAPDTKKTAENLKPLPIHGIGCGDLVFDKFELFKDYKQAVAITGIPFFQVIGNHDLDYDSQGDEGSSATFRSHFGPTWYSFNRGKIHYVVLDNVFYLGTGHRYIGYIDDRQLSWLEKDLALVPKGSTVVVSLHIPTDNGDKRRTHSSQEQMSNVTTNRQALYNLLKNYRVHIMSGHTHYNENWEEGNVMEHNHGTVCGAWWSGPICGDGTPNGYGVYTVDGDELKWHYQSTGFSPDHQITIHRDGERIIANVWNWDKKWKVEWLQDGVQQGVMQQFTGIDPEAAKLYKGPAIPEKHKWVEPDLTDHLFIATAAANAKEIKVKATDRFGNIYTASIS